MKRNKTASAQGRPLDDRDRTILTALKDDAWLTFRELGERANLSPSASQRRVERLRAEGIITGAAARIAPQALGRPLRIYVLVELVDESADTLEAIGAAVRKSDVIEAHYLSGFADVLLTFQTSSMAAYADFALANLNGNPAVRRYRTLTVLKSLL